MLEISYVEHKTNEYAWQQVNILAGAFTVNCQASHAIMAMIRCRRSYSKEHWMVVVAEEDLVNHEEPRKGMDRPVIVVIAAHRG